VEGQLSAEVRVTSAVPQGSELGPLLFLAYVNDIWRNMESTIRLFADDCVIYRKIINNADMEKLQKDLDRLGGVGAVMEEYSYTSTHPLGHTGPVTGNFTFTFIYIYIYILCVR